MPSKKWNFFSRDCDEIQAFADRCEVSPVVAQLLLTRGIDQPEQAKSFLQAKLTDMRPPEELPGLPAAVERIYAAVEARRKKSWSMAITMPME